MLNVEYILNKRVALSEDEVSALVARWETFIDKMKQRYVEVVDGGLVMARDILEANKDSKILNDEEYTRFQSVMESQLDGIVKKSQSVWDDQINEHIGSDHYWDSLVERYGQGYMDWFFEDLHNQFICNFGSLYGEYHDPYKEMEYIKTSYQQHTAGVCCSQCGGNLEIKHMYVIPTYIACPYCSTKNTFTPPSVAFMAPIVAERIAAKESENLGNKYFELQKRRQALRSEQYDDVRAASKVEYDAYKEYVNFYYDKAIEFMPDLKEKFDTQREMKIKAQKREYNLEF